MVRNLVNCWKTRADSQDSFKIPDEESQDYIPPYDSGLQSFRHNLESWIPDDKRPTFFRGWKVLVLRSKAVSYSSHDLETRADNQTPVEKRYLQAIGADMYDLDIITKPIISAVDLEQRMSPWLKEVDEHEGGREKAVVAFFGVVKKNLQDLGKDFTTCVDVPCQRYILLAWIMADG
jgi:hypothetical protein